MPDKVKRQTWPLLIGVGLAMGQAPFDLFWLGFLSLVLLVMASDAAQSMKRAFGVGFWSGFALAFVALSWVAEPFLVHIAVHGWMAPFALTFMATGFGLFQGGSLWLAHRIATYLDQPALGWTALALVAGEALRSYLFGGFPWALHAHMLIDTPLYLLAAHLGPLGLGIVLALSAAGVAALAKQGNWVGMFGAVILLAAAWFGAPLTLPPVPTSDNPRPVVRIVQANIAQEEKWKPDLLDTHFEAHLALTSLPSEEGLDLIVWPEVSVPFLMDGPSAEFAYPKMAEAASGAPVVFGVQRLEGPETAHNSLAVLTSEGVVSDYYDKQHLVPFGEFLPLRSLMERLGLSALAATYGPGFTAGTGAGLIDTLGGGIARPMICYEGIFPHEISADGADFLLMLTNDAWFGNWTGPYQHVALARARSIETGLPMVRAANTGISAVIDARGRILGEIPLNESGFLDMALPRPASPTLYRKFGDLSALIVWIVAALILVLVKARNRIDRNRSVL